MFLYVHKKNINFIRVAIVKPQNFQKLDGSEEVSCQVRVLT